MRISTSDILRLKQPCTTIIEHVEKEKVTFDLFDWTGRITDALKCVNVHTEKISSWLTLTSAVPFSICCRLISKRETSWLSVFSSLSNWFSGWTRKTWTMNLRGIKVLIFDTTGLKVSFSNFPQSSLFWNYCIERLTLASARELDDLKLEEWKHNYFL